MKKILAAVALFAMSFAASAQNVVDDVNLWLMVKGKYHLTDKWWVALEVDPRANQNISAMSQLQFKPEVGYDFTEHLNAGFGYVANLTGEDLSGREDRFQETVYYTNKVGNLTWTSRSRLEQRFFGGLDSQVGETSWRFRQQIRGELPIVGDVFLAASDEIFLNLDDNAGVFSSGFAENRAYGGVGYNFSKHVKVDSGYQARWQAHSVGPNQLDHIWMTNVNFNF